MTLRLETRSLYRALADDGEIHVRCLEVEGVTVHVEHDKHRGLNLWGCLGFDEAEAAQITQEVNDARARRTPPPPPTAPAPPPTARPTRATTTTTATTLDDAGEDGAAREARLAREQARRLRKAEQKAARRARKSAEAEAAAAEPDGHWGVPFELDTARCTFRGVKLHAADFLRNARAAKGAKGEFDARLAIQVKFLELSGSQLAVEDATDATPRGPFFERARAAEDRARDHQRGARVEQDGAAAHRARARRVGHAGAAAKDAYQATTTAAQQGLLDFNRQRDAALGEVADGPRPQEEARHVGDRDRRGGGRGRERAARAAARRARAHARGARPSAYCVLRVTKDGATGQEKAVKAQSRACASTKKPEWREDFVLEVASLRSRFRPLGSRQGAVPRQGRAHGRGRHRALALVKGEELVAWHALADPKGKADGKFTGEVEVGLTLANRRDGRRRVPSARSFLHALATEALFSARCAHLGLAARATRQIFYARQSLKAFNNKAAFAR